MGLEMTLFGAANLCFRYRARRWMPFVALIGITSGTPQATAVTPVAPFIPAAPQKLCQGSLGYAPAFEGRRTFLWRPEWLTQIKDDPATHTSIVKPLMADAEKALRQAPLSVTHKTKLPASGDNHDYASMAPYWWPTPGKVQGHPYSRQDGKVNPERNSRDYNAQDLVKLRDAVSTLSLAYYYTSDKRFATHAALLLRTWFLDAPTRMNPNLAHAQAVPGVSVGRPEGIIEAQSFGPILESIGLLAPSGALSAADQTALEEWFYKLVTWMATSDLGKAERAKANNHGIYYDLLMAHFSLFARVDQVPEQVIGTFPARRIALQFAPGGTLPEELSRTRSWHYTHWTLLATSQLAGLGECVGMDLWNFKTADGRGLRPALNWVAQFAGKEQNWKFSEAAFEPGGKLSGARRDALENLRTAAWGFHNPAFEKAARLYAAKEEGASLNRWLAPYLSE
jgi:hypothetical protein